MVRKMNKTQKNDTALLERDSSNGREIAAIDLGSNSFHMIIARLSQGNVQILSRLKSKVRLASGLDNENMLDQAAIERGVNCLKLFAHRLQGFDPQNVIAVGTFTLRSAVNNAEFLRQAKAVFPYPINIISGETEAKTIYSGVSHTQSQQERKLVIDIGGGSTEMIIGEQFEPLIANSRNMGCVSFAKQFFSHGIISEYAFEQAYITALATIADLKESYKTLGWKEVFGSSGTIKSVSQIIADQFNPNGIITPKYLQQIQDITLKAEHFSQLKFPALNPQRADVFVSGLAILKALFDTFGIERMHYSNGALREGVIYGLERSFQVGDVRERTAKALKAQFNLDLKQAEQTAKTLQRLLPTPPIFSIELQEMAQWAVRLCELGLVINHRNYHKHSAYILQHSELPGFNANQQHLLTTLVRFHQGDFSLEQIPVIPRYNKEEVLSLIRFVRLSVLLNRARQATHIPEKISLERHRTLNKIGDWVENWYLQFEADYLKHNPLITQDLHDEAHLMKKLGLGLKF